MSTNLEINSSELKALGSVIEYLWDAEQADYCAEPRPGHVFLALREVYELAFRTAEGAPDSTA